MCCSVQDVFQLLTPGGGGFGTLLEDEDTEGPTPAKTRRTVQSFVEKGSVHAYRMNQESC